MFKQPTVRQRGSSHLYHSTDYYPQTLTRVVVLQNILVKIEIVRRRSFAEERHHTLVA